MDINLDIEINGNISEKELNIKLKILGELIITEIRKLIRAMDLIKSGQFLQGWLSEVRNGVLIIENVNEYAVYLEYGSYGFWQKHGLETFTDPVQTRKRDMTPNSADNYVIISHNAFMNDMLSQYITQRQGEGWKIKLVDV